MKTVTTATVAVPLQHDGAHIVVEHLTRRAAECQKGILVRLDQRLNPLIGDELDIARPAPAQSGDKHRKPLAAAPNDCPVHLHLLAGLGLKPDHRLDRLLRPAATPQTASASCSRRNSRARATPSAARSPVSIPASPSPGVR